MTDAQQEPRDENAQPVDHAEPAQPATNTEDDPMFPHSYRTMFPFQCPWSAL